MEKKRKFRTAALVRDTNDLIYQWEVIREEVRLTVEEAEKYCRETLAMRDEQVSDEFGTTYACNAVKAVSDDGVVIKVRRQ